MVKEIDESRRKPRVTRGTPAYYAANRIAFAMIGVGLLIGFGFHVMPGPRHYRDKFFAYLETKEEEQQLKKFIMTKSFGRQLRVDELKEVKRKLEEKEDSGV